MIDFDWSPTILIADNAAAIYNGFELAFGENTMRVNCWAHAFRNMKHELDHVKNRLERDLMRSDICKIQLAHTTKIFEKLTELFTKKWLDKADSSICGFIEYFNNNWVSVHINDLYTEIIGLI